MDLELMVSEGVAVKEMEAAAVAWVCEQLHVSFFALKSITDIVDKRHDHHHAKPEAEAESDPNAKGSEGTTREQFDRNLALASASLQRKLVEVLHCIGGSTLAAWRSGTGKANHRHSARL